MDFVVIRSGVVELEGKPEETVIRRGWPGEELGGRMWVTKGMDSAKALG